MSYRGFDYHQLIALNWVDANPFTKGVKPSEAERQVLILALTPAFKARLTEDSRGDSRRAIESLYR